ncbi:MAG TPA: HTH domain-containing protein [Candidatus Deferrimicrobium sp.]|nr:HTH domain-containing protein [Candidatus Deferrimicrobium sp.]
MTKAERLLYLINMIRNRGTVLVSEMAGECGVSQRTIYRDVVSLTKLNFPLFYDHGYRLARDTGFPPEGLQPEDLELICYALRNNPLTMQPYFSRRLRIIEQSLRARFSRKTASSHVSFFIFDKKPAALEKSPQMDIIARFLKAIAERRMIVVGMSDGSRSVCAPLAVRLRASEPHLVMATRTKLLIEEGISRITYVKPTLEKFSQRPLYLLHGTSSHQKEVDDS